MTCLASGVFVFGVVGVAGLGFEFPGDQDRADPVAAPTRALRMQPQAVDLSTLVRESLPLVESLAVQHGVTLLPRKPAGVARADPKRLRQVLINMPPGDWNQ